MVALQIFLSVFGVVILLCGLIGFVYSFVIYKQKQKTASFVMLGISMLGIFLFCVMFPIGAEEYSTTATVNGVGQSFVNYNSAYVNIDGKTEQIAVGEYNRNMFDKLTGHDVEITYGKIHTILNVGEKWHLVDVKIPES